jgi:hypothetical protein
MITGYGFFLNFFKSLINNKDLELEPKPVPCSEFMDPASRGYTITDPPDSALGSVTLHASLRKVKVEL